MKLTGLNTAHQSNKLLLEEENEDFNEVSDNLEIAGFAVKRLLTRHMCLMWASELIQGDSKVFKETYSFMAENEQLMAMVNEQSNLHLSNGYQSMIS